MGFCQSLPAPPYLLARAAAHGVRVALVLGFFVLGWLFFPLTDWTGKVYWGGWAVLVLIWLLLSPARALLAVMRFQKTVRSSLPSAGSDTQTLVAAAARIQSGRYERALDILSHMKPKSRRADVDEARRWLAALAGVRWIAAQSPARPMCSLHQPLPQLHAVIFSFGRMRLALRDELLERELATATSAQLDNLAAGYIALVDRLIPLLRQPQHPFARDAEELLAVATGKSFMVYPAERFEEWWGHLRPVLRRGGGALLAGLRLIQREAYAEAAALLVRLETDGVLSAETDTLRRAAAFLALFARPQWRMTGSDMPRYFHDGCYYLAGEMGVLRYPTADMPEILACCARARDHHARKRRLIEDALSFWTLFGDEVAAPMALLLKRLLEHEGRQAPARLGFWRDVWEQRQATFEKPLLHLMEGITAASRRQWSRAEKSFQEAMRVDPRSGTPRVNLIALRFRRGDNSSALKLAEDAIRRHYSDAAVLLALGRLYLLHVDEPARAEKLFRRALEISVPPTEALVCLGEARMAQGDFNESRDCFEQARQLDPGLTDAHLGLARLYLETAQYDQAVSTLQPLTQDGPAEARHLAHYLLYRTYREKGEGRRALACLDRVPAQFFSEPELLDDIAVHLEHEREYRKAREFAERAMLLRANGRQTRDDPDTLSAT